MTTVLTTDGEIIQTETPFWKTPFNHNTNAESNRTGLECKDPTKTQQHEGPGTDINFIFERFLKTGTVDQVQLPPLVEDFTDVFDFQSAMNLIKAGQDAFNAMDANVRDAFHHDAQRFVSQVDAMLNEADPANRQKNLEILRAMNLAVPPGPVADKTTLGDLLQAIKQQGEPGGTPAPGTPKTGPQGP